MLPAAKLRSAREQATLSWPPYRADGQARRGKNRELSGTESEWGIQLRTAAARCHQQAGSIRGRWLL